MKKINLIFIKMLLILILTLMLSFGTIYSNICMASFENLKDTQKIPSLAPMLEKVLPSVVSVCVEGSVSSNIPNFSKNYNFFLEDKSFVNQKNFSFNSENFYRTTLNQDNLVNKKFSALGSGVIINSEKGYIVTNNHVIDHADTIQVVLNDGRQYAAKVIGCNSYLDIALLQLKDSTNLTAIKIANSDTLKVGDYTIAIGNPYGLGETVTSGIISALGRSGLNIEHYENFIQTDAAINKGNSGGALVNFKGELIGINTAILAPDGGNIGIGFAIPSNIVKNLTNQIITYGKLKHGELGIIGTDLNFKLATTMNIHVHKGTFVSQVLPKSAAEKSGIKSGDIVVALNGKSVTSFSALKAEIFSMSIKTKITLGVLRDGNMKQFIVQLQKSTRNKKNFSNIYVGIEGAILSNYSNLSLKGVRVDGVRFNTSAFRIGLKQGDIIFKVNNQLIHDVKDLSIFLHNKHSILVFSIQRLSNIIYLIVQ